MQLLFAHVPAHSRLLASRLVYVVPKVIWNTPSIDHSVSIASVCYSVHGKFVCYCDDGRIGGSCGVESTTLNAEPAPLYIVEVLLWIMLGLCALAMWIMVVLFLVKKCRNERRRAVPSAPVEELLDSIPRGSAPRSFFGSLVPSTGRVVGPIDLGIVARITTDVGRRGRPLLYTVIR